MFTFKTWNKSRSLINTIYTPDISEELTSGGIHNGQLSMGLSGTGTSSVKHTNHGKTLVHTNGLQYIALHNVYACPCLELLWLPMHLL